MKSLLWGMCTTSAECKTITIAVLTVMSSMDPHMISWVLVSLGMVQLLGFQVGAGISWLNHPVGAGDFVECCPVGVGCSLLRCPVGAG
jgi:hypothetical protein